jgi:hypothetical protein
VACVEGLTSGRYTGARSETLTGTLSGCQNVASHRPCQSELTHSGQIKLLSISARLGFITRGSEPPTVGLRLRPLNIGRRVAMFKCGGSPTVAAVRGLVKGSVIGRLTPIDQMASQFTLRFRGARGSQTPQQLEGGPSSTLTATLVSGLHQTVEQAGLTAYHLFNSAEPMEIKVTP